MEELYYRRGIITLLLAVVKLPTDGRLCEIHAVRRGSTSVCASKRGSTMSMPSLWTDYGQCSLPRDALHEGEKRSLFLFPIRSSTLDLSTNTVSRVLFLKTLTRTYSFYLYFVIEKSILARIRQSDCSKGARNQILTLIFGKKENAGSPIWITVIFTVNPRSAQ